MKRLLLALLLALPAAAQTEFVCCYIPPASEPAAVGGYTITVVSGTATSVLTADLTTYFGGFSGVAPTTMEGRTSMTVPKDGTVTRALIRVDCNFAGSAEAWPMYLRKNATTEALIASVTPVGGKYAWSNLAMTMAVTAGDLLEIKSVSPSWNESPENCRFGGILYIE